MLYYIFDVDNNIITAYPDKEEAFKKAKELTEKRGVEHFVFPFN